MKIAGYILAVYLLLLAVIPCCAFDDCPDDKKAQTMDHEPGDADCGNCSPFFSCEGCSAVSISYEPPTFTFLLLKQEAVYTSYLLPSLQQVEYDFWQPPKLGQ